MIFNFTISGKEDQIVDFEKKLLGILSRVVGDDDMVAHEIHFCIHEALLNIIQHTYKWNLEQSIEINISISGSDKDDDKIIEIRLKDCGPAISETPVPPEKMEKFQIRKRGLYMISKIMDEFRIESQSTKGNVTYMKKGLSQKNEEFLDIMT